jgi:predicted nuclease of predicted toxin-antitoxin system
MSKTIRFHLDENVPHVIARGLRRLGIDVTTTTDAGLLGADDHAQIAYGLTESRVIFTEDRDFLVLASQGVTHSGVAYCHQNTRPTGHIVRTLELIWEMYEPDEMANRIEFI